MQRVEHVTEVTDRVRQYLWSNVGHMINPGAPHFDEAQRRWRVPILCGMERGIFPIGEILLDESLNFVQVPSRSELEDAAMQQRRAAPVLVYADPEELRAKGFPPVTN